MNKQINITEKDIFDFVFSPDTLSKEKLDYLNENRDRFQKEISLCHEIQKPNLGNNAQLIEEVVRNIVASNVIELYPQIAKPIKANGVKLAAASVLTEKPRNSFSFSDKESKYLIRIVKTESHTLLYLFSTEKEKQKAKIKLYPSEAAYIINDLSQPIEITTEETIERIDVL
jgi:hypothetical protein